MQLFYFQDLDTATQGFSFDKDESRHIAKVLRKKQNDILHVTNGLGFLFETEITQISNSKCTVKILSHKEDKKPGFRLHLAVAPTKMNERYEWFLEKATEIGVTEITPIICDHSERKVIKAERFEKIILSAMKQSNQLFLPKFNEAISFASFVSQNTTGLKMIAHCEENEKQSMKSVVKAGYDITMLIGPEGDFSPKEIKLALQNDYLAVSLGETRLRTETAAVVACHTAVLLNEK